MASAEEAAARKATVSQIEQWIVQDKVFSIYNVFATISRNAQTLMLDLVCGEQLSDAGGGSASDSASGEEDTEENSSDVDESCHVKQEGRKVASCSIDPDSTRHMQSLRHVELDPLFHSMALQQYIILCSQDQEGGFRDKPGKSRDFYHTCYCLSGLSVCQYSWSKYENLPPLPRAVMGPYSNLLEPIHPRYNVVLKQYHEAHEYFSRS